MSSPHPSIPNIADVAAHYDDLDELYRSLWGTNIHHGYWIAEKESSEQAVANLTQLVAERAAIRPNDRVCDFGCGYGAVALVLNRDYGAAVTGITISKKQYEHSTLAAAGNPRIEFLFRDALQNGLASESFDAVVAIESTEHIAAKPELLREARRLLRSGGRLLLAAWLASDRPATWQAKYLLQPICVEGRLAELPTAEEYGRLLTDAEFRDVEFLELTDRVKKTWTICGLRLIKRFLFDPVLRRRLRDSQFANRVFAKTVFRIRLAYATGAMRYGIFSALK